MKKKGENHSPHMEKHFNYKYLKLIFPSKKLVNFTKFLYDLFLENLMIDVNELSKPCN